MRQKSRGLVMETNQEGIVTVLTPDGQFLNIPWPKENLPAVGNEVEYLQPIRKVPFFMRKQFIALAACLALFFFSAPLWSGALLPKENKVVAYVNVDINPSIELGINGQGIVLEATGLNEDGNKLLQNLQLLNLPVKEAVKLVTAAAIQEKYITPDKENNVLITVSSNKKLPEKAEVLEEEVRQVLQEKNIPAQAQALEVPVEIHEQAKVQSVSAGKYVIYMEAVEEGLNVSIDDLKGSSLVKVVKDAGGVPDELISKVRQDKKELREKLKRFNEWQKEQEKQKEKDREDRESKKDREDDREDKKDIRENKDREYNKDRGNNDQEERRDNREPNDRNRQDNRFRDDAKDGEKEREKDNRKEGRNSETAGEDVEEDAKDREKEGKEATREASGPADPDNNKKNESNTGQQNKQAEKENNAKDDQDNPRDRWNRYWGRNNYGMEKPEPPNMPVISGEAKEYPESNPDAGMEKTVEPAKAAEEDAISANLPEKTEEDDNREQTRKSRFSRLLWLEKLRERFLRR